VDDEDGMVDDNRGSWVRLLRADDPDRYGHACSDGTRQHFTERLGPATVAWSAATATEIAAAVLGALPRPVAGVGEQQAVHRGIEGGVLCILASVHGGAVVDPAATQEVPQTAREFVRLGVPLHEVWAQVRQAHRHLVDRLAKACQELVPLSGQAAELQHMFRLAFECVDALVEGIGEAYAVESDRWLATAAAVREELVNAVLSETAPDVDTVSQKLRYELRNRHHVGIVLWQHGLVARDTSALPDTALSWLEAAGAQQTLLIPRGQSLLYAWGNRRDRFPAEQPRPDGGFRVAVGGTGYDLAGFRDTHREARDAHRVSMAMPGLADPVVPFSAVSLLTVLSEDRTRVRRFVDRELGALGAGSPKARELRHTLRTYLETRNVQATAARLVIARNTVAYRLRRAEELRGMPTGERPLELWVALLLVDVMGHRGC
jgi:sugar diacid utilization regulator